MAETAADVVETARWALARLVVVIAYRPAKRALTWLDDVLAIAATEGRH